MKKIILPVLIVLFLAACEEKVDVKRIQWTSSSPEAIGLFEEFLTTFETRTWDPERQEKLIDSLFKLDPDFTYAKTFFYFFKTNEENRENILEAYNNRGKVSELEKRLIEAEYEWRVNGNRVKQDQIMDSLIIDNPEYYQLRLWSGDIKNNFNVKGCEKRWLEALEINPNSFAAHVNLAFLHFPTSNNFFMLAEDERDLKKAEELLVKGSEIHPESSRWSRFLGNVYRAQNEFDKAMASYKESLEIIEKNETGNKSNSYANSLLMVGHVNTFQGNYDEARTFYDKAIEISNNNWKRQITVLKSHTYMYQKDFANAVLTLSKLQNDINNYEAEEIRKINWTLEALFNQFLAFGHSQKLDETVKTIEKIKALRAKRLKIQLSDAIDDKQRQRYTSYNKKANLNSDIWYNILFGNYDTARNLMAEFKIISQEELKYNPSAMYEYFSFSGYLNLMEGNPEESIIAYNKLSKEDLTNDGYHSYFLALAKKAIGEENQSKDMFIRLANNNFATWQNSIVRNLAKDQIKTNL